MGTEPSPQQKTEKQTKEIEFRRQYQFGNDHEWNEFKQSAGFIGWHPYLGEFIMNDHGRKLLEERKSFMNARAEALKDQKARPGRAQTLLTGAAAANPMAPNSTAGTILTKGQ